ncbi:WecB/TagA/CpsF family glycosyl transferase [Porphyromonas gingivalis TDC60]|uniref:Glycosyl transferase, WecB/TagA/CpsF family n=1 Tax=Porphyromonas gingivalis (strain ATCC BAA-308 / W83) TaxID=242619 RepID=Q7MXQ1_PORGI|nr:WecB/TagA/CpsF family glycosyltransferase [Porphyromonas gingivalis]AAQ65362.1 glycosyl transferase, WecB/TagA/CpsF family [Porphyromonas gingivalis W83]AKV63360.1 exopolysaccharide biosynthesis protein, WecB/TagA/CpsF family [Porphyromonas gingivalis]AUR46627.1 UDP-N-acetyl-D-mannosaminuronic acid transferase [Porphyromonas gingivalis]AUR48370.1 UDP-N-acetyl-D-mannosaminuronic acid transferase [Porphyromonas gingivalis]EIW90932.1 glycosyltransferase WecB/TagA/CpsF family protein [Porphyrom
MQQILLGGVEVYPFTSAEELISYVSGHPAILVAINAEKILHATDELKAIYNRNLGYSDGAGAVLALKKKGHQNACKIAGCELWLKIIERYSREKSFYLVGGKPEVIEETIQKLRKDFPRINIVGYRDGYLKGNDDEVLIEDIAAKKPDVVFVAMGSPKQELLMERMQRVHPNAIYQGLGGSFDVYTGRVERAPEWWIRHNLEFAYRLIKQPSRIKRQIHLVRFLFRVLTNRI